MKKAILVAACLAGLSSPILAQPAKAEKRTKAAKAELSAPIEYPDVPLGSWQYQVLEDLVKTKLIEQTRTTDPMTKYEFAVAVGRLLNAIQSSYYMSMRVPQQDSDKVRAFVEANAQNLSPSLNAASLTDAIIVLRQDCAAELKGLTSRAFEPERRRAGSGTESPSPSK